MSKTINELFYTYIPKKFEPKEFKVRKQEILELPISKWDNTALLIDILRDKKETQQPKETNKIDDKDIVEKSLILDPLLYDSETESAKAYTTAQARLDQYKNSDYYQDFIQHINKYFSDNSIDDETMKNHLTHIASFESSYDPKATVNGSSASGWFGFTNDTRKDVGNDMTSEQFMNDKNAQIAAAISLYGKRKKLLRNWVNQYKVDINSLGKTPLQLMYGMWWNPGSMQNYLQNGNDSFVDALNMNLNKIFNKAA